MENVTNKQLEILKKLTDARNKLSALYSLFNSSIISAEDYRTETISCIDRMLDLKNALNLFSNELGSLNKKERAEKLTSQLRKIKGYRGQVQEIDGDYSKSVGYYDSALSECLALKSSLMSEIHGLCEEFKETVDETTPIRLKKGYNNQIKLIKKIQAGIDALRADFNTKKNNLKGQDPNFQIVKESVISLITSLEKSA